MVDDQDAVIIAEWPGELDDAVGRSGHRQAAIGCEGEAA
jgi:hypothetical protein